METRDPSKYREYKKWRNKARNMTRKIQKEQERDMARQSKKKTKEALEFHQEQTQNSYPSCRLKGRQ